MLSPAQSGRFKRDVKRMEKRGKDMRKLRQVLQILISEAVIPVDMAIIR
jgi:mRNA interferase YafQ